MKFLAVFIVAFLLSSHMSANSDKPHAGEVCEYSQRAEISSDKLQHIAAPATESRTLNSHPRLFFNKETLSTIREKLEHPVYSKSLERLQIQTNAVYDALRYALWGDKLAGERAKRKFLDNDVKRLPGLEKAILQVQYAILFDWLFPLFNDEEKRRGVKIVKSKIQNSDRIIEKDRMRYYFNDHWGRGQSFEVIGALALAGSDRWADSVLASAYQSSKHYFSPYNGGALDTLNSLALNSGGGLQVGHHGKPGSGYEGMFLIGATLFLPAWESATGESVLKQTSFFEKLPEYLVYGFLHVQPLGNNMKSALELSTGFTSERSKSLAKWLLDNQGRAKYSLLFRLLLGDLRNITPKSPAELDLPHQRFLEGADMVVSRTGWSEEDIAVFMFARHWDSGRYEPTSGAMAIYKNGQPILVRGITGKAYYDHTNNSAVWIWDPRKKIKKTLGQGSTYWHKLNNIKRKARRANSALAVFSEEHPEYRPETLVAFREGDTGATATTRYEKLLKYKGVTEATREIEHDGSAINISDKIIAPSGARVLVSFRLSEEPEITGNTAHTSKMKLEIIAKDAKLRWVGGENEELIGPTGLWHGSKKHGLVPGYSRKETFRKKYGLGFLFVDSKPENSTYTVNSRITVK